MAGEGFGGLEEFVFDHHPFVVAEVVFVEGFAHGSGAIRGDVRI